MDDSLGGQQVHAMTYFISIRGEKRGAVEDSRCSY